MKYKRVVPLLAMVAVLAAPGLAHPGGFTRPFITYAPASAIAIYRTVSTKIKYGDFNPAETTKKINREREQALAGPNAMGLPTEYRHSPQALKRYRQWVVDTIAQSKRSGGPALIIDKAAYEMTLYKNGEQVDMFNIELGFNPVDDKLIEGDGCTPEGRYSVNMVKDKGQSAFCRALLIDYPKASDRREVSQLKADGRLPDSAGPGGMVEIHGCGTGKKGKAGGKNWTLGCVALSDEDMDKLFAHKITAGTPVTIVRYGTRMDYHFPD